MSFPLRSLIHQVTACFLLIISIMIFRKMNIKHLGTRKRSEDWKSSRYFHVLSLINSLFLLHGSFSSPVCYQFVSLSCSAVSCLSEMTTRLRILRCIERNRSYIRYPKCIHSCKSYWIEKKLSIVFLFSFLFFFLMFFRREIYVKLYEPFHCTFWDTVPR